MDGGTDVMVTASHRTLATAALAGILALAFFVAACAQGKPATSPATTPVPSKVVAEVSRPVHSCRTARVPAKLDAAFQPGGGWTTLRRGYGRGRAR